LSVIEAGDLHRDLLEERRTGAFFCSSSDIFASRNCGGRPEAQERHPLFVDVGDLEAEEARVEIDHFREVATVQADMADLALRMGLSESVMSNAPAVKDRGSAWKNARPAGLTASIMYTVISAS